MAIKNNSKSDKQSLTKEDVLYLANLVKLQLSEEEIVQLQDQLGETIDYVQNLAELDTEGVVGLSHTTEATNVTFEDGAEPDRTFSQDDAVANGKNPKNGYFVVDKILDK